MMDDILNNVTLGWALFIVAAAFFICKFVKILRKQE